MSLFREGCEWQVLALADAARGEADARLADGSDPSGHEMAYLSGVRDTLRVLAGDADPRAVRPTFAAAYERYLDST